MSTTQKPKRPSNLQIKNVRIDADDLTIYYQLYYDRNNTREYYWKIPKNTTFEPPEWLEDGVCAEVWTEDIGGKVKDYDWVYIRQLDEPKMSVKSKLNELFE